MAQKTRFLIIGDLHGRMPRLYAKRFDAIIAPGDFCSDESRTYIFEAMRRKQKNPRFKKDWTDLAGKRKASNIIAYQLFRGRRILERLNAIGKPVFVVPGNWDSAEDGTWHALHADLNRVFDCHGRVIETSRMICIGYGISSGPEYPIMKELQEGLSQKKLAKEIRHFREIAKAYDRLFRRAKKEKKPIIFLTHNVPYNTELDLITDRRSTRCGLHFGSVLARYLIEKWQPLICIGGHMHEHFTADQIGKTVCVNAGFGSFVNIIMDMKGKRISKLQFIRKGKIVEVFKP